MEVYSPLTGKTNVALLKEINVDDLVDTYYNKWKVDISRFFKDMDKIFLYKCLSTGYEFYYPLTIYGDGDFYSHFQQYDWYYMPWKWEHATALRYIQPGMKVLEIGCAQGTFIKKLVDKGANATGLELNEKAIAVGKALNLNIIDKSIQEFSSDHAEEFDVVCSFQVMEHIPEIGQVLDASLKVLKKNGLLIISVPNNDSFLSWGVNYLNMPPHHMGLWNENALENLTRIFPLSKKAVHFEPLQNYHRKYFSKTIKEYYTEKNYFFLKSKRILPFAKLFFSKKFKAFTITMVFVKK